MLKWSPFFFWIFMCIVYTMCTNMHSWKEKIKEEKRGNCCAALESSDKLQMCTFFINNICFCASTVFCSILFLFISKMNNALWHWTVCAGRVVKNCNICAYRSIHFITAVYDIRPFSLFLLNFFLLLSFVFVYIFFSFVLVAYKDLYCIYLASHVCSNA